MEPESNKMSSKELQLIEELNKMRLEQLQIIQDWEEELTKIAMVEKTKNVLAKIKSKDQLEECLSYLIDYFISQGTPMTTLEGYGFDWQQFQKDMKEKAGCKDGTRQDGEAQNNNVDTPKPNGPGMALSGPSRLQVNITRALEDMSDTINSSESSEATQTSSPHQADAA
ncbi:uncharacterized protein BKA78DRAFT_350254 [Phyllosticta capitalensis]